MSRHTAILILVEREMVRSFIEGIAYGIRLHMTRETETEASFTLVVKSSRRIERICG